MGFKAQNHSPSEEKANLRALRNEVLGLVSIPDKSLLDLNFSMFSFIKYLKTISITKLSQSSCLRSYRQIIRSKSLGLPLENEKSSVTSQRQPENNNVNNNSFFCSTEHTQAHTSKFSRTLWGAAMDLELKSWSP